MADYGGPLKNSERKNSRLEGMAPPKQTEKNSRLEGMAPPKQTEINSAEYDGKEQFVIDFKDGKRLTALQIKQMFNESGTAPETFVGSVTSRMITDYIKKNNPTKNQFIKHFLSIDLNRGGAIPMNNQMELFGEGGLKDEGGMVDEISGNEVPVGGTKEGVRDDIPANVSEGEFIFPADVVRFVGLDKLMQIRQDAKMGLKQMEAMGQMGNSDEATIDDDVPFSMADLIVVGDAGESMELADGGFIPVQNFEHGGVPHKKLTFSDLMGGKEPRLVMYVNEAGDKMMIPFVDGVPLLSIPAGYTEFIPPELVEGEVVSPEDLETAAIVAAVNTPRKEKEYDPMKGVDTTPVNWMDPEMDGKEFLDFVKERNSYGLVRNGLEAVFSFIPVVGFLGKMAFRDSDKKILEAINARAKAGQFNTPELQEFALFTAGEVEKAGTSLIGKAIEVVGDLLGKTEEETSAVIQLQSIIDKTVKDKTDIGATETNVNGSLKPDAAIIAAIAEEARLGIDTEREDGIASAETNITPTGRDIGSAESIVSGMNEVPTSPSTEIVTSESTNVEDTPNAIPFIDPNFKSSTDTLVDSNAITSKNIGSQLRTNAQMLPNDYLFSPATVVNGNVQSDKYPTLGQVAGGPAVPFSKTSDSLRNIFAGPDDGTRDAVTSTLKNQIAPGDVLNINLSGGVNTDTNFKVTKSGSVMIPSLPPINVANMTAANAERKILEILNLGDEKRGTTSTVSISPATIAKTERTSTEPVDMTGAPGFRDSSVSRTDDLQSTERPTKRTNLIQDALAKVTGIFSGFKIPGQSIDAAGNPIVPTDDDDGSGDGTGGGTATGSGYDYDDTGVSYDDDGGISTGYGGQSSTVAQMTTPSYTQPTTSSGDNSSGSGTGQGFIDRSTASYVAPTATEDARARSTAAGGFANRGARAEGGLINKPKVKKKTKTSNKRGLAARK